jgi:CHAT domain-containing protein/tetratricopeptide (TPR) repeat protein
VQQKQKERVRNPAPFLLYDAIDVQDNITLFAERMRSAIAAHDFEALRLVIAETVPNTPLAAAWRAFGRAVLALEAERDTATAITLLERLHNDPDTPDIIRDNALNNLGIAYEINEQWDRALRAYQDCLALRERIGDGERIAIVLLNMGILHIRGLDIAPARAVLGRALTQIAALASTPRRHIIQAALFNELGYTYLEEGLPTEAQPLFQRAHDTWAEQGDVWGQGIACDNLADVAVARGDLSGARALYQQGRALSEQAENHYQAAQATFSLAKLGIVAGEPASVTLALLDEALNRAHIANNLEIMSGVQLSRAHVFEQAGHVAEALRATQDAVAVVESLRANIAQPDDRAKLSAARAHAYESLARRQLDAGQQDAAFNTIERAKSRALVDMLARRPLRTPERVPAQWLADESEIRLRLEALYREMPEPGAAIAQGEAQLAELRERIRMRDADYADLAANTPTVASLAEARAAFGARTALVEYMISGKRISALVIDAAGVRDCTLPLTATALARCFSPLGERRYGALRGMLPDLNGQLQQPWLLDKLHATLIAPLALRAAETVCVVPHGLLHYLPFGALLPNQPVFHAPSATVQLRHSARPAAASPKTLAIGFNGARLTQAEYEAQRVAALSGGDALLGVAATRAAVLAAASAYDRVHIACHGWFNPIWPAASRLVLSDGGLDVTDIFREMRLDADLVSLSACESGRSRVLRGDELLGITRAFLYAGAASVIASHWVVDDASTGLFFEHFYQELNAAQHASEAAAIAHALMVTRAWLRDLVVDEARALLGDRAAALPPGAYPFAHPYYWAPFYVMGDRL